MAIAVIIGITGAFLIAFQISQWLIVIYYLWYGNRYRTKKDFLLRMIPGYFLIVIFKISWEAFSRYMLLD